jgi:hypothetical protein
MQIKGTAVKSIQQFVKDQFPARFDEWIKSLPPESQAIMGNAIYATDWYPITPAGIIPTKALKMFFNNDEKKAAWEAGRYSAEHSLKGIYKIFIQISSPTHIISRASKIFTSYYEPSELIVASSSKNQVILHILKFGLPNQLIEYRILGWMEKALELNQCQAIQIRQTKSLAKGDDKSEIIITWK